MSEEMGRKNKGEMIGIQELTWFLHLKALIIQHGEWRSLVCLAFVVKAEGGVGISGRKGQPSVKSREPRGGSVSCLRALVSKSSVTGDMHEKLQTVVNGM